jgi:hypothetical protein
MPSQHPRAAFAAGVFLAAAFAGLATQADVPLAQSCRLLDIMGGNRTEAVAPALAELAARWPEENRSAAVAQISRMVAEIAFSGGNVYEIGRLGEDLVEHLVVLRLAAGETAGMRLSYEWTPDGLALTRLDLKLDYATGLGLPIPARAEPLACP